MVAMLIASILLAIAIPSYNGSVRKARRTDARSALLDLAGREERYLSVAPAYSSAAADLGYASGLAAGGPWSIGNGYYTVSVATASGPPPTFTLTASAAGSQAKDTACTTMTVDQLGQHKSFDNNNVDTSTVCWDGN